MDYQTLRGFLRAEPFKPFQILMKSGECYVVQQPEHAFVTQADIIVGAGRIRRGIPDRGEICSIQEILSVDTLHEVIADQPATRKENSPMRPQIIRDVLSQRPFKPFRIVMSSGHIYNVKHPEMALLTPGEVYVGLGDYEQGIAAECKICSLLHVSSIEPIESAVSKSPPEG